MSNKVDITRLTPILADYVNSYIQDSPADIGNWLNTKLKNSMPERNPDEISKICSDIIKTAETNTMLNDSIMNAVSNGQSAKSWFAEQIKQANSTISSGELAKTISMCRESILAATEQNVSQEQHFTTETSVENASWNDEEWNDYRIKDLVYDTADKMNTLSVTTLCDDSGYDVNDSFDAAGISNLPVELLKSTSLKTVVSGALVTAVDKNIIPSISTSTPIGVIGNIACNALNKLDVFNRVSSGAISIVDGIENIAHSTIATITGMTLETKGMALGTAIGAVFGPIGSVVGGAVGGILSRFVGAKIGTKISAVVHKVGDIARVAVKTIGSKIKEVSSKVMNYLFG